MRFNEIIERQWEGYLKFHQSRKNLLIHIIFVPVFIIGFVSFLLSLFWLDLISAVSSLLIMALSIGLQGLGHGKERIPAEPFTSFNNGVIRILLEQLYTFPKFVLTGKWVEALQGAKSE